MKRRGGETIEKKFHHNEFHLAGKKKAEQP
jgi:hypothetical protein